MKIIILAAGLGSRLKHNIPKALVKLCNGNTILDYQLESISKFTEIENIILVTGFKSHLIKDLYPSITQVVNNEYETTNTSKSLLKGLRGINDEVLFLNGDVIFHPQIIKHILLDRSENLISVNNSRVGEEEVKYDLNKSGNVKNLSKKVLNPLGEAVGINYIKKDFVEEFIIYLESCEDGDYFEKAIEKAIGNGHIFKPFNIGELFCCEVDFIQDLEEANIFIKNFNA